MTRATIAIAAALAATLALAGCSGDGKKKNEPEEGPLTKYMSALYDESGWTDERMEADHKKTEKIVAECMTKEGFEYKPAPFQGGGMVFGGEDDEGPQMGTMEFAKQYGYGIIDNPWNEAATEESSEEIPEDPNQKYLESLSESEQQAYSETLYGPQPTAEEMAAMEEGDSEGYVYDWKKAGCQGKAQHEVQGEQGYEAANSDPAYADLMKALEEFGQQQYENNDTIEALDRKWAECMAKADFADFPKRMEAQQKLWDEWGEVQGQGQTSEDAEPKEPSKAEQKKFQEREIEIAVADVTCADKLKYDEKVAAANLKAEQKFVDEHEKQLKALVAQYGVKKK